MLLYSLIVVLMVGGLGYSLIRVHAAAMRRQNLQVDRRRALYVAEAGLSEAYLAVAQGKSGNIADEAVPAAYGRGVYWVVAEPTEDGNIELTSTGLIGVGRFAISVVVRPHFDPFAALGAFSGADLVVEPGVIVDGYESRKGSYAEQVAGDGNVDHTDGGAVLTSNADILLEADGAGPGPLPPAGGPVPGETQVYGELHPGPHGSVLVDPGAWVSGSTTPSDHASILPELPPHDVIQLAPSLSLKTGQTLSLTRRSGSVGKITVNEGATFVFTGPVTLLVDSLRTAPGSRLVFDSSAGPITLVVAGQLAVLPGTEFSSTDDDPRGTTVLVTASEWSDGDGDGVPDPPVVFEPTGEFFGFLHVPRAPLALPGTLRFFGAVAAQGLTLRSGLRMTIDRSLVDREPGAGLPPRFIAWRIVELPDSRLVHLQLDPLAILNLQGVTPTPSSVAHAETDVQIDYFDALGKVQSYTGSAAAMPWADVRSTLAISWN